MRTAETDSQNAEGALLCEANPTVMLEENRVNNDKRKWTGIKVKADKCQYNEMDQPGQLHKGKGRQFDMEI